MGLALASTMLIIILVVVSVLLLVQSVRLRWVRDEAKVAATSLLEQEQLTSLGRMVAGIAHELNTPLSAMSCSIMTQKKATTMIEAAVADLSASDKDPLASLKKCSKALQALQSSDEVIDQALVRTRQLVRVLRLAGRGESDEMQPIDVNGMIKDTLILLGHELKSGVSVRTELGSVKAVAGWPGALGQVVLNLVLNARQALGDQGEITITTEMQGGKVVVTVADNGPGLPQGCAQRLFKAGFTTKTADEGTGLGLYICHNIVEDHNGQIQASNQPAGGAKFVMTLPAID